MDDKGRLIVFSAPSGSGKSTIIKRIKEKDAFPFSFSVSATNRPPREGETHGKDYYFLSDNDFKERLARQDFIEYCEVYPGRFYGTLKSEIDSRCEAGENIVLDVDVEGGKNIKSIYGNNALSIFVMPPSIDALRERLEKRGTDTPEKIAERVARAEYEISHAKDYDVVVINDDVETAVDKCIESIIKFVK